jgi:hypothetical protein
MRLSSQQNCESEAVNEAAAIRAVYPRHTMKSLARKMGVPLDTARHWLYRHFNTAQRRELARALLKEMDEQDVGRSALRRTLAEWASEE